MYFIAINNHTIVGPMTVAELVHEQNKVVQQCVAIAQHSVVQKGLLLLASCATKVVVKSLRLVGST